MQKSYDARSVLQCQEACHRFLDSHTVSKKAEVLKMLYKLSEVNEYETHSTKSPISQILNQFSMRISPKNPKIPACRKPNPVSTPPTKIIRPIGRPTSRSS